MPKDEYVRITLRLPEDLRAKLHACADRSGRSLNAEIVERLGESLARGSVEERLAALERMLNRR